MEIETTIKKIGNSFGVLLPKKFVKEKNLEENKKVIINIIKVADLSDVFGSLKGKLRMSGQQMKDLSRKEWAK